MPEGGKTVDIFLNSLEVTKMAYQKNEKSEKGKRLALILIAIFLIAAIAIGAYTYSRYVSSQNGAGSAQVGMWGFTVSVKDGESDVDNAFSQMYGTDGTATDSADNAVIATVTNNENSIVAPGAKGSIVIEASGIAEVNAKITMALSKTNDVFINISNGDTTLVYSPIVFTLTDNTAEPDAAVVASGTIADIAAYFTTNYSGVEIKAGTAMEAVNYTLSWEWAYEAPEEGLELTDAAGANATTFSKDEINKLDTVLGQLAANNYEGDPAVEDVTLAATTVVDNAAEGAKTWTIAVTTADTDYCTTIEFAFSATIEQIQTVVSGN